MVYVPRKRTRWFTSGARVLIKQGIATVGSPGESSRNNTRTTKTNKGVTRLDGCTRQSIERSSTAFSVYIVRPQVAIVVIQLVHEYETATYTPLNDKPSSRASASVPASVPAQQPEAWATCTPGPWPLETIGSRALL